MDHFLLIDWGLYAMMVLALLFCFFGIDDSFIDFWSIFKKLGPTLIKDSDWYWISSLSEKRILILVANWQEENVLEAMIQGNISGIDYHNYQFLLGVYPNDFKTKEIAERLAQQFSQVQVIVNPQDGPTSKGQMLNAVLDSIFKSSEPYDAIVIHDAEDVIHSDALKLINWQLDKFDFIQIPVFSLIRSWWQLVGGTYMDEFAESHTKDMLVRSSLKAAIPSAGVGTALSRKLVTEYLKKETLFSPHNLTEDYYLGIQSHLRGFPATFACFQKDDPHNFIATREYFPNKVRQSVRQKSRWTLGIALQSLQQLGWQGSVANLYFLYRDRKSPLSNFVLLLGMGTFIVGVFLYLLTPGFLVQTQDHFLSEHLVTYEIFVGLSMACFAFMTLRWVQRFRAAYRVYGLRHSWVSPIRLLVGNYIAVLSSTSAMGQFIKNRIKGTVPLWQKTLHEIPNEFGRVSEKKEPISSR
ncbi:MAG: glycosyltransferase [Bdellovibrionales bacterium]|nr:glycosyltransferase [Bdellovibrionales bacterium]